MATMFKARFITHIPTKRVYADLREVMQEEGESMWNYIKRFNKIAVQIENLSHTEALTALQ